ncbi:MAG: hypothetical protein KDA44_12395 [Planctomycetales bacterium]|nr:hypothetical protein [Planctomycetales bacterium]
MPDAAHDLAAFTAFAQARLGAGEQVSLDELYDQWRLAQPSDDDVQAVQAALRDMAAGETGRPFDEFAAEFRARHGLTN